MKKIWNKFRNLGVHPDMNPDTAKRVRIVNVISLLSLPFVASFFVDAVLFDWPPIGFVYVVVMIILTCMPIVLNSFGRALVSRVCYLVTAYLFILSLPIIAGPDLHYQYMLLALTGLPLLFLGNEIGKKKLLLSVTSVVFWVYLEWHFTQFDPLIQVDPDYAAGMRVATDFSIFVFVFLQFYVFVKESDQQLKQIKIKSEELEKTNEELQHFSYAVSHDLKAPLVNISSLISLVKKSHINEMSDKLRTIFSHIEKSSNRSNNLVSTTLEYSLAGREEQQVTTFQLDKLLDDICSIIKIPEGVDVLYNQDLPTIVGSQIQMEQVLTNLIVNAIKYHDKDKGTVRVSVEKVKENRVKILVVDDGPGIKEKYHQSIFNLFGSANEVSRPDSTGIGLAIVKKLVEQAGGEIKLASSEGKGSTFSFTWPLDSRKESA